MQTIKVAVLVGSLRQASINRRLANAIARLAPAHLEFAQVRLDDLPLYNQDFDGDYPAACQRFKDEVAGSDALLLVTPEYNRSYPGVLKNALDIGSRPYGTNCFAGKPGAVLGASPGGPGTSMAQQHLHNVLAYLDVYLLAQPEVYLQFREGLIDEAGTVSDPRTEAFLRKFVEAYVAWVERFMGRPAG